MRRGALSGRGRPSAFARRRGHRGVADVLATILLVAIVVVLAAVLFILVEQYTRSPSTNPNLADSLALGTPTQATTADAALSGCAAAPCNIYNITVQSAAQGMELHALAFELLGLNGSLIVPPGGIVVLNATGAVVAQYGYATGWTSGGMTLVASHLTIVLYTSGSNPQSLSGVFFRVIGVSGYTGSISVHII